MKFVIALSMLATVAAASPVPVPEEAALKFAPPTDGSCHKSLNYCGRSLVNMDWPRSMVIDRCIDRTSWLEMNHLDNVVFYCGEGSTLTFVQQCNGCANGGFGRDDYCLI